MMTQALMKMTKPQLIEQINQLTLAHEARIADQRRIHEKQLADLRAEYFTQPSTEEKLVNAITSAINTNEVKHLGYNKHKDGLCISFDAIVEGQ